MKKSLTVIIIFAIAILISLVIFIKDRIPASSYEPPHAESFADEENAEPGEDEAAPDNDETSIGVQIIHDWGVYA